jgi:predicted transcriptional regulator
MSDKQVALEAIQQMPETVTLLDITQRLEFLAAVQEGLDQIDGGEVIPHEQVKKELASWLSK